MRLPFMRGIAKALSVALVGGWVITAPGPTALADPEGTQNNAAQTQDSAEKTIADGYIAKQIECTPDMPPTFQTVVWYPPGFTPQGGSGMIVDVNPSLGGPFQATWNGNYWDVEYQYC